MTGPSRSSASVPGDIFVSEKMAATILHKVAGVDSDAATCVALDDRHERRS